LFSEVIGFSVGPTHPDLKALHGHNMQMDDKFFYTCATAYSCIWKKIFWLSQHPTCCTIVNALSSYLNCTWSRGRSIIFSRSLYHKCSSDETSWFSGRFLFKTRIK